jgi:hypothetical protein
MSRTPRKSRRNKGVTAGEPIILDLSQLHWKLNFNQTRSTERLARNHCSGGEAGKIDSLQSQTATEPTWANHTNFGTKVPSLELQTIEEHVRRDPPHAGVNVTETSPLQANTLSPSSASGWRQARSMPRRATDSSESHLIAGQIIPERDFPQFATQSKARIANFANAVCKCDRLK